MIKFSEAAGDASSAVDEPDLWKPEGVTPYRKRNAENIAQRNANRAANITAANNMSAILDNVRIVLEEATGGLKEVKVVTYRVTDSLGFTTAAYFQLLGKNSVGGFEPLPYSSLTEASASKVMAFWFGISIENIETVDGAGS